MQTKINDVQSRGSAFLNQTTDAVGSAAVLHEIRAVPPSVTFMLTGRSSHLSKRGLAGTVYNIADALQL